MKPPECIMQRDVDAQFLGQIDPGRERLLREHLTACATCRRRYARRALLAKLDPESMSPSVRLARGLGLDVETAVTSDRTAARAAPLRAGRGSLRRLLPAATFLAAAALLLLVSRLRTPGELTARGHIAASATVTPSLHVYRVEPGRGPSPLTGTLGRDDELAFAYDNPDKKAWLAVFATDERGDVYWMYPGWMNPSEDPRAIAADPAPGVHALPDAVRQRFRGTRVDFHLLFLDEPLTVRQIEASLGRPLPGDQVQTFGIVP